MRWHDIVIGISVMLGTAYLVQLVTDGIERPRLPAPKARQAAVCEERP